MFQRSKAEIFPTLLLRLAPLLLLLVAPNSLCAEPLVFTTAKEVHDLPAEKAIQGLPVHLVATVTYYEPSERTLFVADSSGAVYVRTTHAYPIHRGDLVKIDGHTANSFRTTVAADPAIQVIGTRPLRSSTLSSSKHYQQLMAGKWDCQYVAVQGRIGRPS